MDWSKIDMTGATLGAMWNAAVVLWPLIVFVLFATVLGAWVKKMDRASRKRKK